MRDNHNVNIDDSTRTPKSRQTSGNKAQVILHSSASSEPENRISNRRDFSLNVHTHGSNQVVKNCAYM